MTPRKKQHSALWNLFFKERVIQTGEYKTRLSLAGILIILAGILIILAASVVSIWFLQWCGAMDSIIKIVKAIF